MKRCIEATWMWIPAVWRSGSLNAIRPSNDFRFLIQASTRLRTWWPDHLFQIVQPRRRVAHGMSLRGRQCPPLVRGQWRARRGDLLSRSGRFCGWKQGHDCHRFEESPSPCATARADRRMATTGAMLPRQPLSFIGLARPRRGHGPSSLQDLNPGAIDQQVQRARNPTRRKPDRDCLLAPAERGEVRHRPVQASHLRDAGDRPVVCRSGRPKSTLIAKQNWMAASEKTDGRPGLTAFGTSQSLSRSSQTSKNPHRFSASL